MKGTWVIYYGDSPVGVAEFDSIDNGERTRNIFGSICCDRHGIDDSMYIQWRIVDWDKVNKLDEAKNTGWDLKRV